MSDLKTTQVEFTGKASEYFGIWIVNLLLSILTLGIYSAWAKVRRKKYFNNNTLIDDVGFDYHAKPIAILKGRIIAFAIFMAYAFSENIHPLMPALFGLAFFFLIPWLVVRASIFNARNTSHRGLRFDFVGKVGEAFRVFVLLPIMAAFTGWLAFPYAANQKDKYLMSSHKFGTSQFDMQAKAGAYFKVYAIVLIVPLLGILAAIAIPAYQGYTKKAEKMSAIHMPGVVGFTEVGMPDRIVLAENNVESEPYQVERVYSEPEMASDEQVNPTDEEYRVERVYAEAEPAIEDAAEVANTEAKEKSLEELMVEREQAKEKATEEMFEKMMSNPKMALAGMMGGLVFLVIYALFIFGFLGYIKARIGNLIWNSATIDDLTFKSSLRARDYIWIYLTNVLAIALTFGLATPWAQVRLARYRASKLQIIGDVDFDQFVGDKKAEVKATGEEIADFFDADFSFG